MNEKNVETRIETLASDYASDLCGDLQASQKEAYTLAYLELLDFAEEIATIFADGIATILVRFSEPGRPTVRSRGPVAHGPQGEEFLRDTQEEKEE